MQAVAAQCVYLREVGCGLVIMGGELMSGTHHSPFSGSMATTCLKPSIASRGSSPSSSPAGQDHGWLGRSAHQCQCVGGDCRDHPPFAL